MDYYAILGVHPTAEDIVIRAAYKALAQRYHPDRFTGSKDEAHRRMSDLTKAYEVLADPVRRPKYDRRRMTYAQSVAASFNGSPKYASSALDPGDPRAAAAHRGRYRVALSALMLVVVVLSAFNLFHYSARLKGWLGTTLSEGLPAMPGSARSATDASDVGTVGVALDDTPEAAPTAKTRNLPVSQGSTPAMETAMARPQPPGSRSFDSADALLAKEKTRGGARSAPVDRPTKSPPTAASAELCSDAVAALGLCRPNLTAKNK